MKLMKWTILNNLILLFNILCEVAQFWNKSIKFNITL